MATQESQATVLEPEPEPEEEEEEPAPETERSAEPHEDKGLTR